MTNSYHGPSAVADELAEDVEWQIRPYREGDIPAIVSLINASDEAYNLNEGTDPGKLAERFSEPRSDPQRQVIIVDGPRLDGVSEGVPVGYGRVTYENDETTSERLYFLRVFVHPLAEEKGLELAITRRLLGIVGDYEADPAMGRKDKTWIKSWTREEVTPIRALWEGIGLREARWFWVMARPLHDPIDEPRVIEGVQIRNFRRPDDNKGALEAFNSSFADHWDHHPVPEEDWNYWTNLPAMQPDLSWLAESQKEPGSIGGFCICAIFEDENKRKGLCEGWIELLGTTRSWRRMGLGRSLLLHGLHSLRSAGMDTALLGVDSESPTGANRLYESVGFRVRSREVAYECLLEEVTA
ncbi:MAG TPA: GNAT family N-acetyltransferase [Chloroflexia bacterium]|nr:GNAT family N-acetyltransferase [Chloroflexia bacterium]